MLVASRSRHRRRLRPRCTLARDTRRQSASAADSVAPAPAWVAPAMMQPSTKRDVVLTILGRVLAWRAYAACGVAVAVACTRTPCSPRAWLNSHVPIPWSTLAKAGGKWRYTYGDRMAAACPPGGRGSIRREARRASTTGPAASPRAAGVLGGQSGRKRRAARRGRGREMCMTHEDDVHSKLTKATSWVVGEVAFLDDLLQSLACKPRAEKHGYAYELAGRAAAHVHVKLKHLGLGFPPELRKEVDALNVVPSIQQRHAWLTYQPGVCDREELEGLLLRACDIATASQPRQSLPRGRAARPGVASAGSDDQADLALILPQWCVPIRSTRR